MTSRASQNGTPARSAVTLVPPLSLSASWTFIPVCFSTSAMTVPIGESVTFSVTRFGSRASSISMAGMSDSARLRTSSSLLPRALRRAGRASGPRSRRALVARSRVGNDGLPSCSTSFSTDVGGSAAGAGTAAARAAIRTRVGARVGTGGPSGWGAGRRGVNL